MTQSSTVNLERLGNMVRLVKNSKKNGIVMFRKDRRGPLFHLPLKTMQIIFIAVLNYKSVQMANRFYNC